MRERALKGGGAMGTKVFQADGQACIKGIKLECAESGHRTGKGAVWQREGMMKGDEAGKMGKGITDKYKCWTMENGP